MESPKYTGLEFLTALKNGEVSPSPMAHTIPMELIEVSEGKATYKVTLAKNIEIYKAVYTAAFAPQL